MLNDPVTLRAMLSEAATMLEDKQRVIDTQQPLVNALERIATTEGKAYTVTETAKTLGVKPKAFLFPWLIEIRWCYRSGRKNSLMGYQDKINSGLIVHKYIQYSDQDGEIQNADPQVMITPKGIAKLSDLLNRREAREKQLVRDLFKNSGPVFENNATIQ